MHSGEMSNISSTYFHHFDFLFIELEHEKKQTACSKSLASVLHT